MDFMNDNKLKERESWIFCFSLLYLQPIIAFETESKRTNKTFLKNKTKKKEKSEEKKIAVITTIFPFSTEK